jgi:hypothetical protein
MGSANLMIQKTREALRGEGHFLRQFRKVNFDREGGVLYVH